MPVHRGLTNGKPFYRWGHQKKYYYITGNVKSRNAAKAKAERQGNAIYAQGWNK